jgi:hypothetical protein
VRRDDESLSCPAAHCAAALAQPRWPHRVVRSRRSGWPTSRSRARSASR